MVRTLLAELPRRESLAEDLRRLAEEKRRVRREEQEEVQRWGRAAVGWNEAPREYPKYKLGTY